MPSINSVSKFDIGLTSSASGAIVASAGPSSIPAFDPNFSRIDGVNVIKTPNANGSYHSIHNVGTDNPTTFPFSYHYTGQAPNGLQDNIHIFGYFDDTTPTTHPSYTWNSENSFDWGDGINQTFEIHENYKSKDRSVEFRPVNRAVYLDTHSYDEHYRCRDITYYARTGTLPLFHIYTANSDGGTVTITNDGSANPFRIDSANGGLFLFNTGSTGGLSINNVTLASASTTVRSSPAIGLTGSYWNGTSAVSIGAGWQYVVDSTSYAYLRIDTGNTSGKRHFLDNAGKVGFGLGDKVFLSQNMVIQYGNYGMVRQDNTGTISLIGLNSSNNVVISPGGFQISLGANFVCTTGGIIGTGSSQRGILDVRGTTWWGAQGSTHAIFNGADGIYINFNANGTGSNALEIASGRSTTSGGTLGLRVESDGGVKTPVKLSIGGGQNCTGDLSATATLTFGEIAAQSQAEQTITVSGAAVGNPVAISAPAALESGLFVFGRVSAANTVTVRCCNFTANPITPVPASYTANVRKI